MMIAQEEKRLSFEWNAANLRLILKMAIESGWQEMTDLDVARWCEEYVFYNKENRNALHDSVQKTALAIAEEIAIQWDFNVYTQLSFSVLGFDDMKRADLHRVRLPRHLYQSWLDRLEAGMQQGQPDYNA